MIIPVPCALAGLAELESLKNIISVMTYSQRRRHQSIRDDLDKKLIAKKAGESVQKVEGLLSQFHMLFSMLPLLLSLLSSIILLDL